MRHSPESGGLSASSSSPRKFPDHDDDFSSCQSMLLHSDPRLAEVPGFSQDQLDALARTVERRRQQLDADIKAYINRKQDELAKYEQELLDRHRSMARDTSAASADTMTTAIVGHAVGSLAAFPPPTPSSPAPRERAPGEKVKQKKHTRVHKREKELYGLVTPVFLPLLDARDTPPAQKKEKKPPRAERLADGTLTTNLDHTAPSRDADKTKDGRKSRKEPQEMEGVTSGDPGRETQHTDGGRKSKRSAVKKSSLRHNNTPRARRKRVSLVIDGQTVLPADTVVEPSLTSPSSETTSPSNSTTSLDDMIDPRLTRHDAPLPHEHTDAVHHSLPIPLSNTSLSPTKPLFETPSSMTMDLSHSPTLLSPTIPFGSSQNGKRSFLDPPATHPASIPENSDPDSIFPGPVTSFEDEELADDQHWDTYVGGLHGSGADDLNQAGSYGYPSSLGASYLESYMQSRPLSVRMQATNKAGLSRGEKVANDVKHTEEMEDADFGIDVDVGETRDIDDDINIIGGMEGF